MRSVFSTLMLVAALAPEAVAASLPPAPKPVPLVSGPVFVSSLGFRPGAAKRATFLEAGRFTVKRAGDGVPVFSAVLDRPVPDPISGRNMYVGDFSSVRASGTYYLELSSCERSAEFPIASDVYRDAYETMMLGFHGQRCGTGVSVNDDGASFRHEPCHQAAVDLSYFDGTGQSPTLVGGWHDAGDYGRYAVNGGFTLGLLLRTWEDFSTELQPIALDIPETGGTLPDFLDEARWQLEWLLAMEYADGSGRFSNALKSPEFPPFVTPESDSSPIALASASSMGTAVAAAVLAQAARVYRPHDAALADRAEQAASRAYAWLTSNPGLLSPVELWAAAYDYVDVPGDATALALDAAARLWAAAEMWVTTGSSAALADFEARALASSYAFSPALDWVDPSDLGIISYLRSDRVGRAPAAVAGFSASVIAAATSLVEVHDAPDNAWGRAQGYWWGSNGTTARSCFVLKMAERIDGAAAWMDVCAEQIGHLMGRNPYGRSQVTGLGTEPPLRPHHRPSGADAMVPPWPGLLIGGPQQNGAEWLDWVDDENDYMTNETAINWNAALVYAFASFLGDDPGTQQEDAGVRELANVPGACVPEQDAGITPIRAPDAGQDAGVAADASAGTTAPPSGADSKGSGCGCRVGRTGRSFEAWLVGLTVVVLARRRRSQQSHRLS